jgi:hypothetical protein
MASGAARVIRGSFVGTGSAKDIETIGFRPRSVRIYNVTGNCQATWLDSMADGACQKVVDSGSGTSDVSFITTNGITPLANGFRLGADSDLNVASEIVHFEAVE